MAKTVTINQDKLLILKESVTSNEFVSHTPFLYHATPSCYVASIKEFGLGGKIPEKRFWDYEGTPYENLKCGVFLATDEYVAESYVETSEAFDELCEKYEEDLEIVVFRINTCDLDLSLLSVDENQIQESDEKTYFYNGIIPFEKLKKITLYENTIKEASPEVDEYEIGGEEKNGENVMGGNYFHAKELNENKISYVDLSEVGEVVIEDWTYDEEEYQEWLVDNELQDTPENKMNYIEDFNVEFDVDLLDNQTYHTMCGDWLYYDDLVEKFGDNMAKKIESEMIENGSFKFDTSDIYADEYYDINNPQELNDIAMKLLPHGEYFKGCRGFILSNGVVVYTEGEHNDVLRIPRIDSKWQFIELGNIRLLPNSIDIGSEPTYEQEEVLEYMLRLYDGEEIYLDIFSENGEIGAHYPSADCNYIMGEINRYYSEGIKPQGGSVYENKEKKEVITESKNSSRAHRQTREIIAKRFGSDINDPSVIKAEQEFEAKMFGEGKMNFNDMLLENYELEVDSSEIDLSSFKKRHELAPNIWKPNGKLNSRVRLKLLDIADDFWEYVNITWVKPSGIILTGSICNFNWSKYSDIDLHLIADFKEIDEKTEFVKEYLDAKKNEWNNEHSGLQIMGYKVELYVQDLEDDVESNGVYDLEENDWIREPNMDDIKSIGLNKFSIKERAAKIMTIIDDMYDALASTDDSHKIEQMGDDAKYLWDKVKKMRQNSLEKDGESGNGNIVYKILRRTGYLDRLFKLSNAVYDKSNSITESVKKVYINEDKLPLLTESQESKSISAAKKLAMQRLGYDEQEADEFVRVKLRNDIPSLRTPQGGKFILGVTRMFCDGELSDAETIGNLSKTIKLVASDAHINEYDRNLNGMSAQDLISRFEGARGEILDADKQELASMVFEANNDYEIVRIDSFEQSYQYGGYVSWCVTHDEEMFDSYTNNGFNQFYFCLKHGFEDVEPIESEGCPLDEYGLSMIAVSVDSDGGLNTCTCRWNHDNGGTDSIMDTKQISTVIGKNFYEMFKPNNKWNEMLNSAMESIANGEDPYDVFWFENKVNGFYRIKLGDKWNFINDEDEIISDKWFDEARDFYEGFARVKLKNKYNFVNGNGQLISDLWFDGAENFIHGFSQIKIKNKYNFINGEGKLLWDKPIDQWFDWVWPFDEYGFGYVRLNKKDNLIDSQGQIVFTNWYDEITSRMNQYGFVRVTLNGKENLINIKGQPIRNQWFDYIDNDFYIFGFSNVKLDGKYNLIDKNGKLVSEHWFEKVYYDKHGIYHPIINGKRYNVDRNGNLTLDESKNVSKKVYINEDKLSLLKESQALKSVLTESVKRYLKVLNEEVVADGNSEHNPYKKRWDAERKALKDFICNFGKVMTSKENGKTYKVYYDKTLSQLIGYNYCICLQWDAINMKPKSIVYIRALDKFTNRMFQANFDARGRDNMSGTYDDLSYRESKDMNGKPMITESKNSKWAQKKTKELIAKDISNWGGEDINVNDPNVIKVEQDFEKYWFGEGRRVDWFIVLEPNIYTWVYNSSYDEDTATSYVKKYVNYIYLHATSVTKEKAITLKYLQNHGVEKRSELSPQQQEELAALIKPERQKLLNFINPIRAIWDFDELKQVLDKQMEEDKNASNEAQANMEVNLNQNYDILGPLSFEEAKKYGDYSNPNGKICYTQSDSTWLKHDYSDGNTNQCYLLLRKDWKNVEAEHDGSEANNGLGEPLNEYSGYDNYGLSMIFVWVTPSGELHESNTRWNHDADYAPGRSVDAAMTEVDIATLMGAPFKKVFNLKDFKEELAKALEKYKNGEAGAFDETAVGIGDSVLVTLMGKHNLLKNGEIVLPVWFDDLMRVQNWVTPCMYIYCKDYCNIVNEKCQLVWNRPLEEWFSGIFFECDNGYVGVGIDEYINDHEYAGRAYNLINVNTCELFLNEPIDNWFKDFYKGRSENGPILVSRPTSRLKYNFLKPTDSGFEYISDLWFDQLKYFDSMWEVGKTVISIWDENFDDRKNILKADGTLVIKEPIEKWPDDIKYEYNRAIASYGYKSYYVNEETGEMKSVWE